jgi:hypothetical protein
MPPLAAHFSLSDDGLPLPAKRVHYQPVLVLSDGESVESKVDLLDIEVSQLRLDVRNPRLPVEPDSQRDAIGEMSEVQGPKLLSMCRHISQHGLNPAQRFVVIPDDVNQYNVMDGNRRFTALRALENPDLVAGRLSENELGQLKQLAAAYSPIRDVPCVVFSSREEAAVWIELLHEGESEGAGSVPWSAQQKARYRARIGAKPAHLQVLDFVQNEGQLSTKAIEQINRGRYPVSTLDRALTTPEVRKQLGIEIEDGEVVTRYPKSEVLKGLTKLVDEIGTGEVKVGKIMSAADRIAYIESFKDAERPDATFQGEEAAPLTEAPEKPKPTTAAGKDRKPSTARQKLIPTTFSADIPVARINDIFHELKRKLRVDEVPNAAGVLLRVFFELSIDDYMERTGITLDQKRETLAKKVDAVLTHMEANDIMTKHARLAVREVMQDPTKATLTSNLNALVHDRQMSVTGNDLKGIWTRLEPFFQTLWA